jgi:hypothetical protein
MFVNFIIWFPAFRFIQNEVSLFRAGAHFQHHPKMLQLILYTLHVEFKATKLTVRPGSYFG